MFKTFDIKLDIEKDIYSPMQIQFNVSNNDDSVQLNFIFEQDEIPFNITGATIQLAVQNPSQQVFYQDIQIDTPIEGKASVQLSQQAYEQAGLHTAEIYIKDVDNTIVTSPFYFQSRASLIQAESIPTGDGNVDWVNVLNKPSSFPPESHTHPISEVDGLQVALDSKADVGEIGGGVPADHTHEIADVIGLSETLDSKSNINHTHPEYAPAVHTHPEYLTDVPPEYLTQIEGDTLYQGIGTIPDHSHPEYLTDVPPEYLTQIEGDTLYQGIGTIPDHSHPEYALQTSLDGKMDDGDAYLKIETYSKAEVYNRTEIDQMTMGEGGGSPVIVEDNLMSTSPVNALSSNQGKILNDTKAPVDHDHAIGDVTGLQTALDGKSDVNHNHDLDYAPIVHTHPENAPAIHSHIINDVTGLQTALDGKSDVNHNHDLDYAPIIHTHPEYLTDVPPEYLTQTEGDALYQATGTIPAHSHPEYLTDVPPEYLTQIEGDTLYQGIGTIPAHDHTFAEITEKPTTYPPDVHSHGWTEITGKPASYPPDVHSHGWTEITGKPTTFTPNLMSGAVVGGAQVGNGLAMSGAYLYVRTGTASTTGLKIDTNINVSIDRAQVDTWYASKSAMGGLTLWKGTQIEYDAIATPDPNTLYFIVG